MAIKFKKLEVPVMVTVGAWLLDYTVTPWSSTIEALNEPVVTCYLGLVTEDTVMVPNAAIVVLILTRIVWVVVP